jgi:hypothetical protein
LHLKHDAASVAGEEGKLKAAIFLAGQREHTGLSGAYRTDPPLFASPPPSSKCRRMNSSDLRFLPTGLCDILTLEFDIAEGANLPSIAYFLGS